MKPLHDLEKTAEIRRVAFQQTFQSLKSHVTAPPRLIDTAVLSAAWLLEKYLGGKRLERNHKPKTPTYKQEINNENRNQYNK